MKQLVLLLLFWVFQVGLAHAQLPAAQLDAAAHAKTVLLFQQDLNK